MRDYGMEIDELRAQISQIQRRLDFQGTLSSGSIHKVEKGQWGENTAKCLEELEDWCNEHGQMGALSYVGVFSSGGRQSTWGKEKVCVQNLMELVEDRTAERVLSCINGERLRLLLALIRKPMSVTQMIQEMGYGSTGQAYHHLRMLQTADLVYEASEEEGRGIYAARPYRIQGILLLLAGVADLVDDQYTRGKWE